MLLVVFNINTVLCSLLAEPLLDSFTSILILILSAYTKLKTICHLVSTLCGICNLAKVRREVPNKYHTYLFRLFWLSIH